MSGYDDFMKALDALGKSISEKEAIVDKSLEATKAQVKKDSEKIDLFVGLVKEMGFYDKSSPNPYDGKSVAEILSGMTAEFPDPGDDEEEEEEALMAKRKEEKKRIQLEQKKKEEQERLAREEYERKQREEQERIKREKRELEKRQREEQERIQREKKALEAQRTALKAEERVQRPAGETCFVCKKPVTESPIHVRGMCCHKQCFRCAKCSKPLIKYHLEQGKLPICQECFESDASNRCSACGKVIGPSGHIKVGEKKYHKECFCCAHCGNMLPQRHYNMNGKLYCSSGCANRASGNLCHKCHEPLSGSMITVLDKKYHKECFVCLRCGVQFTGLKFFPVNGEPYCESCAKYMLARK